MRRFLLAGVLFEALIAPAWAQQPDGCWLRDAATPDESTIYALCENGVLLASQNSGPWEVLRIPAGGPLRALYFADARQGFVAGDAGLVLVTSDGGHAWNRLETGLDANLTAIQAAGRNIWVAGFDGVIAHSADAGQTWERQRTYTTRPIECLRFLDETHGWAAGWSGMLLRTSDGGTTWQQVNVPGVTETLSSLCFRDPRNGWVVGMRGAILRTRDGGTTWQRLAAPVRSWLTSITFSPGGDGWIAAAYDLLRSDDGGETWQTVSLDTPTGVTRVVATRNSVVAIGSGLMLTRSANESAWRKTDVEEVVRHATARPGAG